MKRLAWTRVDSGRKGYPEYHAEHEGAKYVICSWPYCNTGKTFDVFRDGVRVPLMFSSQLKETKRRLEESL